MGHCERRGARRRPYSQLSCLLGFADDFVVLLDPDGSAGGALQEVLGVAVGMHVDLDTFAAVTFWAMHDVFSCCKVVGNGTI